MPGVHWQTAATWKNGPMRAFQGGAASGSAPQSSPPSATGGPSWPLCHARGRGWATCSTSTSTRTHWLFQVKHWNAVGVQHVLHERSINICCIQKTHLQSCKSFKIRGYQCFRIARSGRHKGWILRCIRNNIHACETAVHMEGAEYHAILRLVGNNIHACETAVHTEGAEYHAILRLVGNNIHACETAVHMEGAEYHAILRLVGNNIHACETAVHTEGAEYHAILRLVGNNIHACETAVHTEGAEYHAILRLVGNNIHACETAVHTEGAEYQAVMVKLETGHSGTAHPDPPLPHQPTALPQLHWCPSLNLLRSGWLQQPLPELGVQSQGQKRWGSGNLAGQKPTHHHHWSNKNTPTFYSRWWHTTSMNWSKGHPSLLLQMMAHHFNELIQRTPQPSTPDDGTPLQWTDPKDTPAFYSRWWHTTSMNWSKGHPSLLLQMMAHHFNELIQRTPQPSTPDDGTPLQWIDPKDTPAFYSRWWHTTSTPHLALCMGDIHKEVNTEVG